MRQELIVTEETAGERIDKLLSEQFEGLSRTFLQTLLKSGGVYLRDKPVKASYRPSCGEIFTFELPEAKEPEIVAEEILLDILYEDADVILVNKPKGMVVHPSAGHTSGTLVNALLYHCRDNLSGINGILRPGIVHRIDMDTTGVLIACKNDLAHNSIAAQLKEHSITRRYTAIIHGVLKDETGTIDAPIGRSPKDRKKMCVREKGGKPSVTHYRVLKRFQSYTYIECRLETGRTHQIRVHMAHIGHPLLGDVTYGPAKCPYALQGQTLHAGLLGFLHPRTQAYMEFTAPEPEYFQRLLATLV